MTSRSVTTNYTLEFTDKTSTTVKNVTAAVQGLGTASSAALGQMTQSTTTANTAMDRLKVSVTETERSAGSLHASSSNVFEGFLQAQIVTEGLEAVGHGIESLIGDSVRLAGSFEQSQIGFTAMLGGNKQAADAMLAQLQALANVTPFTFEGEQQAARQLLAMGQTAAAILPELHDIDTAVAAIGGNDQQVGQVTAALAKMGAEGHVSAIFMNELTRDGVPAWTMLAEEMSLTVAQVRALSTQGAIASSVFDQAFHDYTVTHWGDALQAQSQTFDGLISTASDFGQQLERVFGAGIIQELEPRLKGALEALQNPAVLATIRQWGVEAGQFAGWLFDAATWVAQMVGGPLPQLTTLTQGAAASANDFAGNWTNATAPVETVKNQVKDMRNALADQADTVARVNVYYENQATAVRAAQTAYNTGMTERIAAVRAEQTASDQASQSRLTGLHAQVSALQEAYRLEDERIALTRDQAKLSEDEGLAGDIFSSAGASARSRLIGDRQTIADEQRKISRQSTLDSLQDRISAEEAAKRSADQGFAARLTALDTEKRHTDANYASELAQIADKKTRYDQAAAENRRVAEAAIRGIEATQTASTTKSVNTRMAGDDLASRYAVASQQSVAVQGDSILDRYGETRAAKLPNLMEQIFGTPDQQQGVGERLGQAITNGIAAINWTGVGEKLGEAVGSGARNGIITSDFGRILRDAGKGDLAAIWKDLEYIGVAGDAGSGDPNSPPARLPGILGGGAIAGSNNPPTVRTGLGPNDAIPAAPPPGRSYSQGHYTRDIGGRWVWVDNDPTHPGGGAGGFSSSGSFGGTVPYTVPGGDSRPPQVVIHVGSIIGTDTGDLARTISEQIANQTRGRH